MCRERSSTLCFAATAPTALYPFPTRRSSDLVGAARARRGRGADAAQQRARHPHLLVTASVVIVAHRPHRWIREAVASVVSQADEVILVDNGSGGAVVDLLPPRSVHVVSLPRNVGFPAGVNAGVAMARGDI